MTGELCRSGRHLMTEANTVVEHRRDRTVHRCRACRAKSRSSAGAAFRARSFYEVAADHRVEAALPLAQQLVGAVREQDRDAVAELTADADWPALLVALAAMVPDDATPQELLAWRTHERAA